MEEQWKDIVGYESMYQISNLGRVKSLPRIINRVLNGRQSNYKVNQNITIGSLDKNNYRTVGLYNRGISTAFKVHRLVAFHFVDGCQPGLQVNHKNGVKEDNNANNLEWVTPRENIRHAYKTQLNETKRVVMYTIENGYVGMFDSAPTASRFLGVNRSHIQEICRYTPRRKRAGGYIWRYFDQLKLPPPSN